MIRAGELRHTVVLERRVSTQDAAGGPVDNWVAFATRRAALERKPGREVFSSEQRQGRVPTVFRLRFLSNVLPEMRLTLKSHGADADRRYNITDARDPDGHRAELVIEADEIVEPEATGV